ncbi:MAG: 50S ribosomal protein L21 [Bauldia litoralis]
MFAVIKSGGKQYRVEPADLVRIDKLDGDAGDTVSFDEVLMVGSDSDTTVGGPLVAGATVTGEIVDQTRDAKILVFKKRRRQNSRRSRGHRQMVTVVRIGEILTDGKAPEKKATPAKAETKPEAAPAAEAAPAPKAEAAPAGKTDDLKRLSGVGPVLEKKLHALGVTTFAQVAAWTADDIARIDGELNFKGRIEREDWIGQANALIAEDK